MITYLLIWLFAVNEKAPEERGPGGIKEESTWRQLIKGLECRGKEFLFELINDN